MGNDVYFHALESRLLLSAGDLDSSFGQSGFVNLTGVNGSWEAISSTTSGGYLLAGATLHKGLRKDLIVARYTSAWALDPTFGNAGVAEMSLGVMHSRLNLNLRSDGKPVIAADFGGTAETLRLTANGSLDQTFGKSGFVKGFIAHGLQSDGSMIGVSGHLLQRRTPRGGLVDPTFGAGGSFDLLSGTDDTQLFAPAIVKLESDGKIVAGAELGKSDGSDDGFVVRRFLKEGQPDPTFDSGGFYADHSDGDLSAMSVAPDGRIFAGAFSNTLGAEILELTSAGAAVQSFQPLNGPNDVTDIAIAPNGDIDVLSSAGIEQLLPDGSPDPRFDDGRTYSLYSSDDNALLLQSSAGKLLLIGDVYDVDSNTFPPAVSRINTQDDGSPIQRYSHSDIVVFYGTSKSDHISVTRTATSFTFSMNGISRTFLRSNVRNIEVMAGAGNDVIDIDGRRTNITIDAGDGNDRITIHSGDDAYVTGDNGDDFIDGSGLDPKTTGGLGAYGGAGDDHIIGSRFGDYLEGDDGNDTLDGDGDSSDGIYGDSGNDVLLNATYFTRGGAGNDTLYGVGSGDKGDDTYFIRNGQFDTIFDEDGNNRAQIDNSKSVHDTLNGVFTLIP